MFASRSYATVRRAFTLIELLIVIAIIALLISILLPALQAARAEGNKTVCVSDIKEILKGNSMYEADNGESRELPWYNQKPQGGGMVPAYGAGEGMYADPDVVTPWVFGGFRAPRPEDGYDNADSSVYPAQWRPLNKYLEPTAHANEGHNENGEIERGKDVIKLYQCPGDRFNKVTFIGGQPEFTDEQSRPAYEANGSSYSLNTRWLQGYYFNDFRAALGNPAENTRAFQRIARGTVGGAASRFIQWVELGMYSACQNAAERLHLSGAQPQRVGWHRKFSFWSVGFADGHAAHGYFDTRQVYGLDGTIWQPDYRRDNF